MSVDLKVFKDGQEVWNLSKGTGSILAVIPGGVGSGKLDTTLEELGGGTVFAVPLMYTEQSPGYEVEVDSRTGNITYRKPKILPLAIGVFT